MPQFDLPGMTPERMGALETLQKISGYRFKDLRILSAATTHSSYANENKDVGMRYNERLEFLGDAVCDLIVSEGLFCDFPEAKEGDLTKARAQMVCESSFAQAARNLNLGACLLLGRGEEITGGRERPSVLADAFEAFCGAIYMDGGYRAAKKFIHAHLPREAYSQLTQERFPDYKTSLQEFLHRKGRQQVRYKLEREEGPDHAKHFYMLAMIGNKVLGRGHGRSKKEAEQSAAQDALDKLKET